MNITSAHLSLSLAGLDQSEKASIGAGAMSLRRWHFEAGTGGRDS